MTHKYSVERVIRVYDGTSNTGHFIDIGPSADFPGNTCMKTFGDSEDYFGSMRIDMPAEFMKLLGLALIEAAEHELKEKK